MPDVEGQWDFYPNLRLKIKHTLSVCGNVELFTPSHTDIKSTLPLPLCHKSQMLSQTVQLALSGGAMGGGTAGTRAPFRLCPGSWLAAGRQRQQQPVD